MERQYKPARNYWVASILAAASGLMSFWIAVRWQPAWLPVGLFFASSALLIWLALRPAIQIHPDWLQVGSRRILWDQIERVDQTGWVSPLIVRLTLASGERLHLIYPGDLDSSTRLLRDLRRKAWRAQIDGVPQRLYWGAALPEGPARRNLPSPRYRIVREEDEEEIERLYQRLKTVGYLDPSPNSDEKGR